MVNKDGWWVSSSSIAISWEKENVGSGEVFIAWVSVSSYSQKAQPYRIVAFLSQITVVFYYPLYSLWVAAFYFDCLWSGSVFFPRLAGGDILSHASWALGSMPLVSNEPRIHLVESLLFVAFHSAVEHLSSYFQALSSCFSCCSRPHLVHPPCFVPCSLWKAYFITCQWDTVMLVNINLWMILPDKILTFSQEILIFRYKCSVMSNSLWPLGL